MDRRSFVRWGVGGTALASSPFWLVRAYASLEPASDKNATEAPKAETASEVEIIVPKAETDSTEPFLDAYREARRTERPLLVFVIPRDDAKKWSHGRAIGAFLNHGTDEQLAPLGLCVVSCATLETVRKLTPDVGDVEPWAIVIRSGALGRVEARAIKTPLPEVDIDRMDEDLNWDELREREARVVDTQIAFIAKSLRSEIAPKVTWTAEQAQALAASARATLVEKRVPGSKWARSAGCGITIEGADNNVAVGCGMGHVPEKSRRLLYYFAKNPYER